MERQEGLPPRGGAPPGGGPPTARGPFPLILSCSLRATTLAVRLSRGTLILGVHWMIRHPSLRFLTTSRPSSYRRSASATLRRRATLSASRVRAKVFPTASKR